MATLKDIATRLGVDVSTVSKVLQGKPIRVSPEKREQIHRIALEMHYRPNAMAQSLRLKRSGAIAMPIPSLTNYVFPELITGAQEAADKAGLVLLLLKQSEEDSVQQLISLVEHGRADGLLFVPTNGLLEAFRPTSIPFISLNRTQEDEDRYVALDDRAGFDKQAEFLAELGHKTVAFIKVLPDSYSSWLCESSFVLGASARGVSCPESHRLPCSFEGDGYSGMIQKIMGLSPRPTAIATASVVVATLLAEEFRRNGVKVPEDVSIIGYHDSPIAQWPPPGVTTVKMPSRAQGYHAVEALSRVIAGEGFAGETVSLPPCVVDRGSCGRV